jgi:hypothetical protein
MPVQSGSDRILKAMRRAYRRDRYLAILDRVRASIPDAAITTDIIVGFPGETEQDFTGTLNLVRQARFAGAFTFRYSIRPGTPAATMDGQVPAGIVQERYERLTALVEETTYAENQKLAGATVEVLVAEGEGRKDAATHRMSGRARDNRLVHFTPDALPPYPGPPYPGSPYPGSPYPQAPARSPQPPPGSRGGRSGLWIALVIVAVLLVGGGGGFAAWKFLLHKSPATPIAGSTKPANQTGTGSTAPVSPSPTPSPTPTPAPSPTLAAGGIPLSPSAQQQPDATQVGQFVVSYFAAINAHSYSKYTALLDPAQVPVPSRAQFRSGFGSTADSAEKITSISSSGSNVAAGVRFTSHQAPAASPTGTSCTAWRITLFLEPNGGSYLIGAKAPGYHAQYRPC